MSDDQNQPDIKDNDMSTQGNKPPEDDNAAESALARNIAAAVMKDKEKNKAAGDEDEDDDSDGEKKPHNRGSGKPITLGNGIQIFPAKYLDKHANSLVECYAAEGVGAVSGSLVAILCNKAYPPRMADIKAYQNIKSRFLPELKYYAPVPWADGDMRRNFAIFYENIQGEPLMPGLKKMKTPPTEEHLVDGIVIPLITALSEMYAVKLFHGSIRPNNIYYNMLDRGKTVVLGDCLSTPASSSQPALFETIPRSMAQPLGKGKGTYADDIYALGVTVALLALGRNPLNKLSDDEILQRKLEMGSFNAICGGTKPPAVVLDMLRGVLVDDADVRWNIEDLRGWAEGKRHAVRQPKRIKKASRALQFGSHPVTDEVELGVAMAQNPAEGYRLIESGELDQWLQRSVGNKEIFERYETAKALPFEMSGRVREEAVVSRVCMALDPEAPIRFQRLSFYPFAIGAVLNEMIGSEEDVEKFKSVIDSQLITFWFSAQTEKHPEMLEYLQKVEALKNYIKHRKFGNGVERCLYFLYPDAPCQSQILSRHFVGDMHSLLVSLEDIAGHKTRPKEPIDLHIGAFIAQRFAGSYEGEVNMLGAIDSQIKYKSLLTILANMQEQTNIGPLKRLAGWIRTMIEPAVAQFSNKTLQKKVMQKMEQLAEKGAIRDMLSLLQNKSLIKKDKEGFFKAQLEYRRLSDEEATLEMTLTKKQYGMEEGRGIAVMIATSLLAITALFFVVTTFGGGSFGG